MDPISITMSIPSLLLVAATAGVSAANPFAIGAMIVMMSAVLVSGRSLKQLIAFGLAYISAIFIGYLCAGTVILFVLSSASLSTISFVSLVVAALIIIVGILELKDHFWYASGMTLSVPQRFSQKLARIASGSTTLIGVFTLGIIVGAIELPSTGAPYLAIITLVAKNFGTEGFGLLILYNLIFILPLFTILGLVLSGIRMGEIKAWKERNKGRLSLLIGVFLVGLGWLLLFSAVGIVNLG